MIVDELQNAKNLEYKTKLLAFINCLIISAGNGKERSSVRNEFIGLKLLQLISEIRREGTNDELSKQIDLFEEQRKSDDNIDSLDVNSHQDIFFTILRQVSGQPEYETPFLHLLQHLLTIDYGSSDIPSVIWETASTLVHRATTLIESRDDADKLIRWHTKRRGSIDPTSGSRLSALSSPINLASPTTPQKSFSRNCSRPLSPAESKFEPIQGEYQLH